MYKIATGCTLVTGGTYISNMHAILYHPPHIIFVELSRQLG